MDGFRFDLMGHLMKHTMVISLIYGHSNSMLVSNTHQNSVFRLLSDWQSAIADIFIAKD